MPKGPLSGVKGLLPVAEGQPRGQTGGSGVSSGSPGARPVGSVGPFGTPRGPIRVLKDPYRWMDGCGGCAELLRNLFRRSKCPSGGSSIRALEGLQREMLNVKQIFSLKILRKRIFTYFGSYTAKKLKILRAFGAIINYKIHINGLNQKFSLPSIAVHNCLI